MPGIKRLTVSLLLILFAAPLLPLSARELVLDGLKVYKEKELRETLGYGETISNRIPSTTVIARITSFYKGEGYTLIKVYLVENTAERLHLYVDEGRLGKIVFYEMGTFDVVTAKMHFDMPHKVFNIKQLRENFALLQKEFGYDNPTYTLVPTETYNSAEFQLDRELNIPVLGKKTLPFFDQYPKRYDLAVYLKGIKRGGGSGGKGDDCRNADPSKSKGRFGYGISTSMSKGFIPRVAYYHKNIFAPCDRLEADTHIGIMYGLDRQFDQPARMTYYEADGTYYFKPFISKYFTPKTNANLYRSKSGRPDLGLLSYDYWRLRITGMPGITILDNYHAYVGIGIESTIFGDSVIDEEEALAEAYVEETTETYPFFNASILIDILPIRLGRRVNRNLQADFSAYSASEPFQVFTLNGQYDFEFRDWDIWAVKVDLFKAWNDPPFRYESPVSGNAFSGLGGYYTTYKTALGNMYTVSLYKEYMRGGGFFDVVYFTGSGYDLNGPQGGIAGGPVLYFLVLDQFELMLKYGQDLLFSKLDTSGSFSFSFYRKW